MQTDRETTNIDRLTTAVTEMRDAQKVYFAGEKSPQQRRKCRDLEADVWDILSLLEGSTNPFVIVVLDCMEAQKEYFGGNLSAVGKAKRLEGKVDRLLADRTGVQTSLF